MTNTVIVIISIIINTVIIVADNINIDIINTIAAIIERASILISTSPSLSSASLSPQPAAPSSRKP